MDGTVHEDYLVLGVLDNEFNLYLNNDGLRSTSKIIADAKLNHGTDKLFGMDVNENLAVEASLSRVYAVLKYTSNNEADLFTQNLAAEVEGNAPVFKVTFKSSATSVIVFLEYDLDASTSAKFEDEALNMDSKVVLTHSDMTMNVNHATSQALRKRRQADDSVSHHTLNVDITSPTFTDMNIRLLLVEMVSVAQYPPHTMDSSAFSSVARVPSQMNARFYGRLPSAPEDDVDILAIRSSPKDADKMTLQIAYNMEAPKYQITTKMSDLKDSVLNRINEAYAAAINYDDQMSQLSIFYRNTIVEYQKSVQVLLDAVIKS
ncbi:unnamed protein product [Pleuronectes platessa]|uniref:Uncharacterized protein n=1 Tax=Pleuronectes platessa TaxID=8262 RepID=A0A9N7UU33_PLEPL|nr:unnamed protein product [Pleuronectes platessa]